LKANLLNLKGELKGQIELPKIFSTPYRPDLIKKVYVRISTHRIQPQSRAINAGEWTSAESWGVGRGAARMARVKGAGSSRANQAAGVASVVGGRVTHPPNKEKKIFKEINRKERRLAMASAIAATTNLELVSLRGHKISNIIKLPIVIKEELEKIKKTNEFIRLLEILNISEDIERVIKSRKTRSGTSRRRGRSTRTGKGPLIVVNKDDGVFKAARNIPGVECVIARNLNIENLAPGSHPGRLVIWSDQAISNLPKSLLEIGE